MMFCTGLYAMFAQIILTRELMVAFYGNELTIGIIFAAWLLMVGAGSLVVRPLLGRAGEKKLSALAAGLLAVSAAILPLLVFAARALRVFFCVPMGEYMGLPPIMAGAFLVLAPVCLIIGILFPVTCRLALLKNGSAAGVYAAESAGSMSAGVIFSFALVNFLPPLGVAVAAAACGLCGSALVAPRFFLRKAGWAAASGLVIILALPGPINALEMRGIRLRWESFGVLPRGAGHASGQPRLVASRDSRYQNLALIESEGQKTLYGNGQVIFAFPDQISAEQKIHFIMAQKPDAKRVLLIGGSPANDIPELLKYPLTELIHVELDALINGMLSDAAGDAYRRAGADPRLRKCPADGPRFVKNSREIFDVVIVEAPEPTTVSLNRFYTVEFFRGISRILAPRGFLYTAVNSSEQLRDKTAGMTASIYRALQTVFPRLLATAGPRVRFFAGKEDAPLTFDGKTLYARWRAAGVKTDYFRPEYFLNADEISVDKTDFMLRRLAETEAPANSALKPISAFYSLLLWSKYSGSRLEHLFGFLYRMRFEHAGAAAAVAAVLFLIFAIIMLGRKTAAAAGRAERIILITVVAVTGFAAMALELVLIFMFQTLLGYIYASIGLILAMFMLGLTLGAAAVRKYPVDRAVKNWMLLLTLDLALILAAAGLPFLMENGWRFSAAWPAAGMIYFLTLLAGFAGGAQFILAAGLLGAPPPGANCAPLPQPRSGQNRAVENDARVPRNIALLNAVDLFGAALGGLCIGIVFLPLFGFGGTCWLLVILKAGTAALIGARLCFYARSSA
ncbi:MAG: hypothetical protein PHP98_06555 [Kiritimatiellae bacterium]|nr:hypothetical protein [Kiritimatiellia bacterium]